MTLQELKQRCESQGFKYAYGMFKDEVEPPHLVAKIMDTNNFSADNVVYNKNTPIKLDYTYISKNIEEQEKIENIINKMQIRYEKSGIQIIKVEKGYQMCSNPKYYEYIYA